MFYISLLFGFLSTVRLVSERWLCSAPLHASVWTPSQTQEVTLRPHGPEERLLRSLSKVRLPLQAHPPEKDHVSAAARPAVHAQPQARARPEPARVRQGSRWSGNKKRRRSWRRRTGYMGSGLHAPGRHHSLTGKRNG